MSANADQQTSIDYPDNLLILAPPGSGKTKTMISKAASILRASSKHRIAMVTFTDAATTEIKERLAHELTATELKRVSVATFHKHTMQQLRAADKLGRLMGPQEVPGVIQRAIAKSGAMCDVMEATAEIEKAKLSLTFSGDESPLVAAYEELRLRHRSTDLWDVVREAVLGMQAGTVAPLNVTHLLADEFQDSDRLQLEWTLWHTRVGITTAVVGDDDQSIYGWRGALGYEGMMEFRERANAAQVVFQINYRSNREILLLAESVIRHNTARVSKPMMAHKGPGGNGHLLGYRDALHEADSVASLIAPGEHEGTYVCGPGSWAIIARTNAAFQIMSTVLRAREIAYYRAGRDRMDDIARRFCQFLNALVVKDEIVLENTLSAAGIDHVSLDGLHRSGDTALKDFFDGQVSEAFEGLPEDQRLIRGLARLCRVWRAMLHGGQLDETIDAVREWFKDNVSKGDNDTTTLQHFSDLITRLRGSLKERTDLLLRDPPAGKQQGVALHTLHSAKGLEFDNVAIISVNSGTLPSSQATSIDEERRLFFVGITRARHQLYVSYLHSKGKSPFVNEYQAGLDALAAVTAGAR